MRDLKLGWRLEIAKVVVQRDNQLSRDKVADTYPHHVKESDPRGKGLAEESHELLQALAE